MDDTGALHCPLHPSILHFHFFLQGRTGCSWSLWPFSTADGNMCANKTSIQIASGLHSLHEARVDASSADPMQVALLAVQSLQRWPKDQNREPLCAQILCPSGFHIVSIARFHLLFCLQPTSSFWTERSTIIHWKNGPGLSSKSSRWPHAALSHI